MRFNISRTLFLLVAVGLTGFLVAGCGSSSSKSAGGGLSNAVDRAFVAEMIPHHMMAVQMASSARAKGDHGQTTQLAGSITTDQNREIAQMTAIARQLGVKPAPMPMGGTQDHMDVGAAMAGDAKALGLPMGDMGMSMNMDDLNGAKPFDRAFIDMMITHHAGAIRMARAELGKGSNPQLKKIAEGIVAAQTKEIGEMNSWRTKWYGSPSPSGGVPRG